MKLKLNILLLFLIVSGSVIAQTVKHFAGKPYDNDDENELPKGNNSTVAIADAYFYKPEGITWVGTNMWVTQNHTIRLFYNGQVYNRGGHADPSSGASYVNATTSSACRFFGPSSITSDVDGNLYIVEWGNHAIRKMAKFTSTGQSQETSTFAGALPNGSQNGTEGSVIGTGTAARFYSPQGIIRHTDGKFYVTDLYNSTIRSVTAAAYADILSGTAGVVGFKDGKGVATWSSPYGIATYDADNIIVSDQSAGTIRMVNIKTYEVTTIAGVGGETFYIDGTIGPGGTGRLESPKGIAVVGGRIFVCDGNRIRVIDIVGTGGTISTYAGSETPGNKDGDGTAAQFGNLAGIAYKASENLLYVTDVRYNTIKTITIVASTPKATFTASKTTAVLNTDVVTFTNTTTKAATKLTWKITPITGYTITSGSLSTSPLSVKFTTTGTYSVQLDVTTADGPLTTSKTVTVTPAGISTISNGLVKVFPNPSNGLFTLQGNCGNFPILSYFVTDITGKVLISKTCDNSLKETFDMSAYQNGFYFLRVNTSHGSNTLKLQKN